MQKLAICPLIYIEPEWKQTLQCVNNVRRPFGLFLADRDGVGNMSRAFNEVFRHHVQGNYEFVWFPTNVTFMPALPDHLMQMMEWYKLDAIHPAMASSDHLHLRPDGSNQVKEVPFIELAAAMFRVETFQEFLLCEQTPYYYMDLIISHQIKQAGGKIAVDHGATVEHTYLRNSKSVHEISRIRKRLRDYHTPISQQYMAGRFGLDWKEKLWHNAK